MGSLIAHKTFFHVLHSKLDNKWHIKQDNAENTIIAYDSKEEAIREAMNIAETTVGIPRQVIVHKANGTFGMVQHC